MSRAWRGGVYKPERGPCLSRAWRGGVLIRQKELTLQAGDLSDVSHHTGREREGERERERGREREREREEERGRETEVERERERKKMIVRDFF